MKDFSPPIKNMMRTVALCAVVYAAVITAMVTRVINAFTFSVVVTLCINVILACSLNIVAGYTGQFSLGHAGFMSIGAYACALIILRYPTVVGFYAALLAAALSAAAVGIVVGLPALRLRGDYLAIATLGMAEIIRVTFLNMKVTNGAAGLSYLPQLVNWNRLYLCTAGSLILMANFVNSSPGRACISIREDEIAAEAMGIDTTKYKVMAFSIGAFFAGIAGALYAAYFYFIKPDLFGFAKSIDILVIVVVGGMGSLTGSVIASVLLVLLSTALQRYATWRMILYALLLIGIMLFRPQGLLGKKN